jgi:hypothetical protein
VEGVGLVNRRGVDAGSTDVCGPGMGSSLPHVIELRRLECCVKRVRLLVDWSKMAREAVVVSFLARAQINQSSGDRSNVGGIWGVVVGQPETLSERVG